MRFVFSFVTFEHPLLSLAELFGLVWPLPPQQPPAIPWIHLYGLVQARGITCISVGHRPSLRAQGGTEGSPLGAAVGVRGAFLPVGFFVWFALGIF